MRDLKLLMDNIVLGECPRWHDGRLWFSDWGAREMIAVDMDGKHEVIDRVDALPFSFDWQPDGRQLVIADKTLWRREANGVLQRWVNLSDYGELGWNEIVVDERGNIYLNNVNFNFPGGAFRPGHAGLVTPDGKVRIVAEGLAFPNGMAVTPDNRR
ncbi:MAG: SMP-30/gluconolactonase/LRE family protein [Devosia sp.]